MSDELNQQEPKKNMGWLGKGCLIVIGLFVGLIVLGAIVGDDGQSGSDSEVTASAPSAEEDAQGPAPADTLTGPQKNAVRSAGNYIDMSGFSRKGLIGQLSSDYGDGYNVEDATAAVDSLNVDWNEQAARSAKSYLDMSGFSCKGLIDQLSSDAGSEYTVEEATYGANQAGAC